MHQNLPQHVAIVMDGNGRWAARQGLARIEGHRLGTDVVKTIIRHSLAQGIKVLSLFAFSSENWSRPPSEVSFLMQLFLEALAKEIETLHSNGICIRFCGDRSLLSVPLQDEMYKAEQMTHANGHMVLNIAMNYGGKWDILQAAKQLFKTLAAQDRDIDSASELEFAQYLNTYDLPDPDLFIRTSGEQRVSNFFLWQLAYTELYFTEVCWPEFDVLQFDKALESYRMRDRRYGNADSLNGDLSDV